MTQKFKIFINDFGLPQAINRPYVPATKELDLSGPDGQQRIKMDMEQILVKYAKTFEKLAKL